MNRIKYLILILFILFIICFIQFQSCKTPTNQYLNLDTAVHFVGMQTCAGCHQDIYQDYIHTGMGKSFYKPNKDNIIEIFHNDSVVYDTYLDFYYQAFWKGNNMYIKEFRLDKKDTVHNRTEKVDYIVGSGNQTRSYIINRQGFLYEAPITWYVAKQRWDVSPGYENGHNSRFNRPIGKECMNCHNGYSEIKAQNHYQKVPLGIDCERCHGAGQLHVSRIQQGEFVEVGNKIDYSIVNPAKLSVELQMDICQQCHLQGVNVETNQLDFKPGMPLTAVRDVFLVHKKNKNAFGIASHAERFRQSKCFIATNNKLTCTSCHNPHKTFKANTISHYNKACENCHSPTLPCTETQTKRNLVNDNCSGCHLPKGGTSDIPHVQFTDHFIRVVKETKIDASQTQFIELLCATNQKPTDENKAIAYLTYYEQHNSNPQWLDSVTKNIATISKPSILAKYYLFKNDLPNALSSIDKALEKEPQNSEYHFIKGEILETQADLNQALISYQKALTLNPLLTEVANKTGALLLQTNIGSRSALSQAKTIFEKALIIKPFDSKILTNLAFVEMNLQNLTQAEKLLQHSLYYDPDYAQALENYIYLLVYQNNIPKAKQYLKHLEKKHPNYPKLKELRKLTG